MALHVIDFNDSGIRVLAGGRIVLESPACALVEPQGIELGSAALARAQVHPHRVFDRFWQRLDQVPLRTGSKGCRHHADLAFLHLAQIYREAGAPRELVFAVPGSFTSDQLALLLGIARASRIPVLGLVDAAVAGAAATAGPGRYTHVDLQLHQAVLTEIEIAERVMRVGVETTDGAGLRPIQDACVIRIADAFVAQSRFDPLHHAATEQQIHDGLPRWLEQIRNARELVAAVVHEGVRVEARLEREAILATLRPFYRAIEGRIPPGAHCLLTDRLSRMPGFAPTCASCHTLPAAATFDGCRANLDLLRDPQGAAVAHVTALPAVAEPLFNAVAPPMPAVAGPAAATHVLCGHRAYRLSAVPVRLGARGPADPARAEDVVCALRRDGAGTVLEVANGATVLLNGRPVTGAIAVSPGDRIALKDGRPVFTPIVVTDGHAP